jgi:hypothetical protein
MRMKWMAAAVAVVALGGCSSGGDLLDTTAADGPAVQASATPAFLAQAAERTTEIETGRIEVHMSTDDGSTFVVTGQFDTVAPAGSATVTMEGLPAGGVLPGLDEMTFEIVYDGTDVYLNMGELAELLGEDGAPWFRIDAGAGLEDFGGLDGLDAGGFFPTAVRPEDLLADLRAEGIEVTEVGPEEVRGVATTHYAAALPDDVTGLTGTGATLDVWIDAGGLVRRVEVDVTGDYPFTLDAELFDLGEPVTITVPPADQVLDLGDLEGLFGKPR